MDRTSAANNVNIGGGRRGYRDRNLGSGLRGTALIAADRNAIQEEILAVQDAAGLTPNASDWTQLLQAGRILFGGGGTLAGNGWQKLAGGLIVNWGLWGGTDDVGGSATLTVSGSFALAFPTACFQLLGTLYDNGAGRSAIGSTGFTTTGGTFSIQEWDTVVQSLGVRFLAIGH